MMTSRNDAIVEKRDLHVGGVGSSAPVGLATMVEPWAGGAMDASERWLQKARDAAQSADGLVRDNRWAAIGVVAFLGLAAGYFLSRRS
jgi:hypothetical protein